MNSFPDLSSKGCHEAEAANGTAQATTLLSLQCLVRQCTGTGAGPKQDSKSRVFTIRSSRHYMTLFQVRCRTAVAAAEHRLPVSLAPFLEHSVVAPALACLLQQQDLGRWAAARRLGCGAMVEAPVAPLAHQRTETEFCHFVSLIVVRRCSVPPCICTGPVVALLLFDHRRSCPQAPGGCVPGSLTPALPGRTGCLHESRRRTQVLLCCQEAVQPEEFECEECRAAPRLGKERRGGVGARSPETSHSWNGWSWSWGGCWSQGPLPL